MAKCTNCGFDLPNVGVFCPNCATPVKPSRTAETATISDLKTISPPEFAETSGLAEGSEFHERYIIERKLGAGAMGVVYLAEDKVTSRKVALKLVNTAFVHSASARQRFIKEGLIARDVRHRNVIAMYDVGEFAGQVYLVMEYLPGETLRKWLRRSLQVGEDIPLQTATSIIRSILEGLSEAHAAGVIHRDLKPENIMLMESPKKGEARLKILDFGIARAVGESTARQLTSTSSSTGTPLYMAPEQKTAAETVGPPADIYAVTAIFYELLIGVAPDARTSVPSKQREDLSATIDAIIEKGLSGRPRSRYQNAKEYLKALDDVGVPGKPGAQPTPQPVPEPPPVKPAVKRCVKCAAELRPDDQFCGRCATPVNEPPRPSPVKPAVLVPQKIIEPPVTRPPRTSTESAQKTLPTPATGPPPSTWLPGPPVAKPTPSSKATAPTPAPPAPKKRENLGAGIFLTLLGVVLILAAIHELVDPSTSSGYKYYLAGIGIFMLFLAVRTFQGKD